MYSKAGKIGLILLGMTNSFAYGSAPSSNQWVARKPSSYQASPQKETGALPLRLSAPVQRAISPQTSPVASPNPLPNSQSYIPYNKRAQPQTEPSSSLQWGTKKEKDIKDLIGAQKTLEDVLQNDASGINQRRFKASEGRALQALGEEVSELSESYSEFFGDAPKMLSKIPDPHAAIVGSGAMSILSAIKWGGRAIGMALAAVGRYKETAQKILSVNEQIVEAAQQSFERIEDLTDALNEKVEHITLPKLANSDKQHGPAKSFRKKVKLALSPGTWENTVKEILDKTYFTDFKSKTGKEIKIIQDQLMVERTTFEDYIRLLQIRILEESIKNIQKLLNKKATLEALDKDNAFLEDARRYFLDEISKAPSRNEEAKRRKALEDHNKKIEETLKEKSFYQNYLINPQKRQELESGLETLTSERDKLYRQTRLFKAREAVGPLEKAEFTLEEKENNKKEIENLKKQMENLQVKINTLQDNLDILKNKDFEETTLESENKSEAEGS